MTIKAGKKYTLINGYKVTVLDVSETHVVCERQDSEGQTFGYRVPIATFTAVMKKEAA